MMNLQHYLVAQVAKNFPRGFFYQKTRQKVIALTIDDVPTANDPNHQATHLILDAIAQHNAQISNPERRARATFFLIGSHLGAEKSIINQIIGQRHEIGNHGVEDTTHANLSLSDFKNQFEQAHEILTQGTNASIRWYRPGRGWYNQDMIEIIQEMGHKLNYEPYFAMASMIPIDTYQLSNNPQFTSWYVSQFIFPGSILVLHGGSQERSQNTAAVLPKLLFALYSQRYLVVSLSELWQL